MNDLNAAPLPTSSPEELDPKSPAQVASQRGTSLFAFAVGLWFCLLTGFFGVSAFAMLMRWHRGSDRPEIVSGTAIPAQPPPASTPPPSGQQPRLAIVTVPPGRKNGVVRMEPSLDAKSLEIIPAGEVVEILDRKVVQGKIGLQVWYRVKATIFGRSVEGWMHSDILKMMDDPHVPSR
jgi:hypothetical protein